MKYFLISFIAIFFFFSEHAKSASPDTSTVKSKASSVKLNNNKINNILFSVCDSVAGVTGNWQVIYKRHYVFIITDETNNRMRVFTPVIEEKKIKTAVLKTLLEANFDKALDAKYALYNEYLWTVFTHPLAECTTDQFKDALNQVVRLANTYGLDYTSTDLIFGTDSK